MITIPNFIESFEISKLRLQAGKPDLLRNISENRFSVYLSKLKENLSTLSDDLYTIKKVSISFDALVDKYISSVVLILNSELSKVRYASMTSKRKEDTIPLLLVSVNGMIATDNGVTVI